MVTALFAGSQCNGFEKNKVIMKRYTLLFWLGMFLSVAAIQAQDNRLEFKFDFNPIDKIYDGTTEVETNPNLGFIDVIGAESGDEVHLSITASVDDPNVGENKKVKYTCQLIGKDASKYLPPIPPTGHTINITKKATTFQAAIFETSKEYDGTINVNIKKENPASLSGIIAGEDVGVKATIEYDSKNAGLRKIKVKYEITGEGDPNNYEINIPQESQVAAEIYKRNVTVNEGGFNFKKFYDGTTSVKMLAETTLNDGDLIEGDDIQVEVEASYADSKVDLNVPVYVKFKIKGKDVDNYQLTESMKTLNGMICEHITGTTSVDQSSYCQEDVVTITASNLKGNPKQYYDNTRDQWFDYGDGVAMQYAIPNGAKGGKDSTLLLIENFYGLVDTFKVEINIGYLRTVTKIFEDVISVINTDGSYTGKTIQWYHDGVKLPGATELFYLEPSGKLTGYYYYRLNEGLPDEERSCNFFVDEDPDPLQRVSKRIRIYPNPIENQVNIDLEAFEENTKHTAQIYDLMGNKVMSLTLQPNTNTVDLSGLAKGIYTVYIEGVFTKLMKR